MKTSIWNKIWNLILFLLLVEIFYFYATYVQIGGFGVGYQYLGCIAAILAGGVYFLLFPDLPGFWGTAKCVLCMMCPFLSAMLASFGIWVFSFTRIRQMISGFFEPAYMLICLGAVGFLAYMLKEKLVNYLFWAVNAAFSIMVLGELRLSGAGEFFYQMYVLVTSNAVETLPIMRRLELPRFSYVYVFFAIYYLYRGRADGTLKFIVRMSACVFFFLVGYKRSCMLAFLAALLVSYCYFKVSRGWQKRFLNLAVVLLTIFALGFVPVVRNGVFDYVVNRFEIDTNHRQEIYEYYKQYYQYDPAYMGQGLGWAADHQRISEEIGDTQGTQGIHNEYIRDYIELGFWGYAFWVLVSFPWLMKMVIRCREARANAVLLASFIALAVLYLTENIRAYYAPVMVMGAIAAQLWQQEWGEADEA